MMARKATDSPDTLHRLLVPHVTPERVRGVGRVGNHGAVLQALDHMRNQAGLGILRVYLQVLRHLSKVTGKIDPVYSATYENPA
jgi:hypothetical protein